MVSVTLRFDEKMKKELDDLCDSLGMNLTTFFMVYAKKALKEEAIPFKLSAKEKKYVSDEEYFNPVMMKFLEESEKQIKEGKVIYKTLEELKEYEK